MRAVLVGAALAVGAWSTPAVAEKCVTPAQGKKLQKATEARNRSRYLGQLSKQHLKPIKLKWRHEAAPTRVSSKSQVKGFNVDPFETPRREVEPHDGTIVDGEVWFTTSEHVCASDVDEFRFATDKAGNVYRVNVNIERSDRPEPLVCGCEPPSRGCGVTGDKDTLYIFKLPKGAAYKGDKLVEYTEDDAYLRYTNTGCKPRELPR